jgi:chromosome segregation ATPase
MIQKTVSVDVNSDKAARLASLHQRVDMLKEKLIGIQKERALLKQQYQAELEEIKKYGVDETNIEEKIQQLEQQIEQELQELEQEVTRLEHQASAF